MFYKREMFSTEHFDFLFVSFVCENEEIVDFVAQPFKTVLGLPEQLQTQCNVNSYRTYVLNQSVIKLCVMFYSYYYILS